MKWLLLMTLFMVVSCSSVQQTQVQEPKKFMSHEEIVKSFNDTFSVRDELDEQAKDREKDLNPISKLIPASEFKKSASKSLEVKALDLSTRKGADLSDRDTPIKSQWNGTCTAFATTAGMENLLKGSIELSERSVWSKYGLYSSEAAINAVNKNKVCTEVCWPQGKTSAYKCCKENEKYRLKSYQYNSENLEAVLDGLDAGYPQELALNTPKDMLNCSQTIRPTSGISNGGHAILIVGYKIDERVEGGGYFKIKNSWGSDCGDKGYQYLPFSLWKRNDMYTTTWSLKEMEVNGAPVEPDCEIKTVCKRVWYTLGLRVKCSEVKVCK